MYLDDPTFVKCECEKGNRWTFVRGGIGDDTSLSGEECYFSGCEQDHKWKIVGETKDRNEAHTWFRNVNIDSDYE